MFDGCHDTCEMWTWYTIGDQAYYNNKNWENNGMEEVTLVSPTVDLLYFRLLSMLGLDCSLLTSSCVMQYS